MSWSYGQHAYKHDIHGIDMIWPYGQHAYNPICMIFVLCIHSTMERVITQTEWFQLSLWSEYFDTELDLSDIPHLW